MRYYERRGLLAKPRPTTANDCLYSVEALRRVRFITQARQLGFSLAEVKALPTLRAAPQGRYSDLKKYAGLKIADIDRKIRALNRMRRALGNLQRECSGIGPVSRCPILASLEENHGPDHQKSKF